MGLQPNGFAAKPVNAPEAILGMANEGEPRWAVVCTRVRMIMRVKDSPHDILINLNAEGIGDLLGDPRTAETWVTSFHLDDGTNVFW